MLHVERRNGRLFPRVGLAPGAGKVVGWELSRSDELPPGINLNWYANAG